MLLGTAVYGIEGDMTAPWSIDFHQLSFDRYLIMSNNLHVFEEFAKTKLQRRVLARNQTLLEPRDAFSIKTADSDDKNDVTPSSLDNKNKTLYAE